MKQRRIAVTLGDPSGIGPEIALKAYGDPRIHKHMSLVLFGDKRALDEHARLCGLTQDYHTLGSASEVQDWKGGLAFIHVPCLDGSFRIGEVCALSGAAAIAALDAAVDAAQAGFVDAVVGSPIHEVAIKKAGIAFDGHPSYLARRTGTPVDDVSLMLCWGRTRVAHVTLHMSVREALDAITSARVENVIRMTSQVLRRLGLAQPRIGVSGVNPHAGESGLFGREEIEIIGPTLNKLRAEGFDLLGPMGADTLLPRNDCDAFVVMLHDQGHVAARVAAPNMAAAMSIGTPVMFSSVGHGTAMDIAGRGVANPEALIQALLHASNSFSEGENE
ncbi:MAG: 4-hydroxythreonine-4-phosphate dehydrogenase PdxA [Pigmentiphaga sp.]|uniref:PdxA family dehydrogenase n=1 Tax=Pigmentiphaga sp. TaxID=1977564 RepID=UPI0029B6E655|nr:4-hydroxythreonine-4-phosphate dehydrogenase PdxA [Pigmentiphaga sp.]MDX3908171.1 4-hydroxythreonine-4-phosphate dehydrogenase PdxA [Pigmentiphaga sp.]